ncbi:MAG: hypothetical protein OHK0015_31940 [Chloroflexi bacterium OHK40]
MIENANRPVNVAARPWWRGVALPMLLTLLAGHFALVQLLTGVQFGDAPRNLHWGLLTWEQPAFLIGATDGYERIKGFPPEPPELGPRRLWERPPAGLHPWWGPLTPLFFAAVWGISRSYTLVQLVVPLAAGAGVLLTYAVGRRLIGHGPALAAAIFLSCYPLFREYGTVSYNETLGALVLAGALYTYLAGRTAPAVALGALAALTKMDLLAIYAGTVGVCALYDRLAGRRELPWRHHLLALFGPLVLASPWIWFHYLGGGERGPTRTLSPGLFAIIFPMMIELTFYIPWYGALLSLAVIAAVAIAGVRTLPPLAAVLLGTWLGLGLLVTLIYCATPGAGNSPRVFIPALPALAMLFGAGAGRLPVPWRRRAGFYLAALFLTVNLLVIGYQARAYGSPIRAAQPAFAELRERERGFVLTPLYWETILFARQPATWFEADPDFERAIMGDPDTLARYLAASPIRYVLLPDPGAAPGRSPGDPASPAVRAYLDASATRLDLGPYTLWVLE